MMTIIMIWAFSVVILSWSLTSVTKRAWRNRARLREIRGEDGFAYSLSFILTVPFVMLIVALVVESTLLLTAQVGTQFAAYAGARSAIVWDTALPLAVGPERIRPAAVHAMAPFASGNPVHQIGLDTHVKEDTRFAYVGMYRRYCPEGPLGDGYLMRKLVYAHHALSMSHTPPPQWDSATTVGIRYEHPFHWQIIGRALGHPAPWGGPTYTYTLEASVTLQNEGAKNEDQSLGIHYDSDY